MTVRKLKDILGSSNSERIDEDYEVGDAARAYFDLTKESEELTNFLKGEFRDVYKKAHEDGNTDDVVDTLRNRVKKFNEISEEVVDYLWQYQTYQSRDSMHRDGHRKYRKDRHR